MVGPLATVLEKPVPMQKQTNNRDLELCSAKLPGVFIWFFKVDPSDRGMLGQGGAKGIGAAIHKSIRFM